MERYAVGIDLGGTKIEAVLTNQRGDVLEKERVPTEKSRIDQQITELCRSLSKNKISAVGIGAAGQIDSSGTLLFAPNLELTNFPLGSIISKNLNLPVAVINDVRAAAIAEWKIGSAKNQNNVIFVFLGTGIGGAIISNGCLLSGSDNIAGEIGHTTVNFTGPMCSCGSNGCLEVYAAGWGLAKLAGVAKGEDAFKNKEILDQAFLALSHGIKSFVNIFNPELVIIGGGLAKGYEKAIPHFYESLESSVKKMCLKSMSFKIKTASLQSPGAIGASINALDRLI